MCVCTPQTDLLANTPLRGTAPIRRAASLAPGPAVRPPRLALLGILGLPGRQILDVLGSVQGCRVGAEVIRIPEFFFGFDPPRATNQPSQPDCPLRLAHLGIRAGANQESRRQSLDAAGRRGAHSSSGRFPSPNRRYLCLLPIVSVVIDTLRGSPSVWGCPSSWGDSPCPGLSRLFGLRWLSVLPHSPGEPSSGPLVVVPSRPSTHIACNPPQWNKTRHRPILHLFCPIRGA